MGGVCEGCLSEPTPVSGSDLLGAILWPRFCIAEHRGVREPELRLIDDITKPNVNRTVQMTETYCPKGLDSFVALTRLRHVNGAGGLKQWSVDFPHAHKTIALRPSRVSLHTSSS